MANQIRYAKILIIVFLFVAAPACLAHATNGETEPEVVTSGSVCNVSKPSLKRISIAGKTSITLLWKPVSSADGYKVYRVEEDGTEQLLSVIKGKKGKTYTDTGLTYGKTYRYIVRAYKKKDETVYYSEDMTAEKKLKARAKYVKGYKYYYDMEGNRLDNVESFIGKKSSYLVKVNIKKSVVTIYAKDGKRGYTIPVKAYLCSGRLSNRTGTWHLGTKTRYRSLYFNCFSQWTMDIHDNYLFHTVPYKRYQDANSLDVKEYNKLGTPASHGCIRLQCVAAKWLYDNCDSSTKVVFYNSDSPGPLGKPKLEKLPSWHTWDPTDPNMKKKCKKKGCNHIRIY